MIMDEHYYMQIALCEAKLAMASGEVPIGAVLVMGDGRVFRGHNETIKRHDPAGHAEIVVINQAIHYYQNHRLPPCTLYVTLEPCLMCIGTMAQSRVKRLVYAAPDTRYGLISQEKADKNHSLVDLASLLARLEVTSGIGEIESQQLLNAFFNARR